jgi:hypothetical protein
LCDVASTAGLTAPVIYGGVESNAYIVVAIGCGAAFLDYDNDGWLDILVLTGARWEGARLSGRRGLIQTESGRIVAV